MVVQLQFVVLMALTISQGVCVSSSASNKSDMENILKKSDMLKIMNEIKGDIAKFGVSHLDTKMKERLEKYKHQRIKLAVTGQTGAGKSSLINTMRGLRPRDKGAVAVGVTETTKKIQPFQHPNLTNYILYDVPGVNSPNFPKSIYIQDIDLLSYDCIIICTHKRFKDDDLWLAQSAADNRIPFVLVRTHVDLEIHNAARDEGDQFDEEETLLKMYSEMSVNMYERRLPTGAIFLISTVLEYTGRWGYPNMMRHVLENLPKEAEEAFIMSLIASSEEVIHIITGHLRSRITLVATYAAFVHTVPGIEKTYLETERQLYRDRLGVTEENREPFVFEEILLGIEAAMVAAVLKFLSPLSGVSVMVGTTAQNIAVRFAAYYKTLNDDLTEVSNRALSKIATDTRKRFMQHNEL